jgi:energy-coupling factor transport system substrate-specific component
MMSAIIIAAKEALSFLPNIELVSLLIILSSVIYGKKTIYIIYTFVIVEGFLYGISLWFIYYLYVWTILFFIARLLKNQRSSLLWAIVSGSFGLGFGALCSVTHYFIGGFQSAFGFWVSGIPFDITHGISNFITALILFKPMYFIMNKINRQIHYID